MNRGNNWYVWEVKDSEDNIRYCVTYQFQRELVIGSLSEDEKIVDHENLSEALGSKSSIYAIGIQSQESNKNYLTNDEGKSRKSRG